MIFISNPIALEDQDEGLAHHPHELEEHKVCKDPYDLLHGIGDLFVQSDLGVNFSKGSKGKKQT